jgi:phosphoribosylamine---glycine ligase
MFEVQMNILIVGQGGREHALAHKAVLSPLATHVYVAPGNAGTASLNKTTNVAINATDIAALATFAKEHDIALTLIGPEAPLALGIVDYFESMGLACFGPSEACAKLESSKAYSKQFMVDHHIPTGAFATFTDPVAALAYIDQQPLPIVIKASGLAAGKGVVIATTKDEAYSAVDSMLTDHLFGQASDQIVIEEFLDGEELSFMVMCDGTHILELASSQDHKARDAADRGPNTGGMGAYSPAPILNDALRADILKQVIEPTIKAFAEQGTPYVGFLYAGLMIDNNQRISVLEFNCRLGDPETQVILMRLKSDLIAHCQAALQGTLNTEHAQWDRRCALDVVLCAQGYPQSYNKGDVITGLDLPTPENTWIFHAGTQMNDSQIVTHGGRVLAACALGDDILSAQQSAYALAKTIHWDGVFYREDIGYRALERLVRT